MKLLLTHRRNLKRKFLDLENAIRRSLKSFGVRHNKVGRGGFDEAVRDSCAGDAFTAELMEYMLSACAALWRQYLKPHKLAVLLVARDELCRRFMAIPGAWKKQLLTIRRGRSIRGSASTQKWRQDPSSTDHSRFGRVGGG
jgi:transposase